jgi:hypothetical protein
MFLINRYYANLTKLHNRWRFSDFKSLDNKTTAFKTMRYKYEFDPALSPMATGQRVPQKACTPTQLTPFGQIKLSDLI